MKNDSLRREMGKIIDKYGPWVSHNMKVADNLYTMGDEVTPSTGRVASTTQMLLDLYGREIENLKILDLGSLEGMFAIEIAMHGATVVGIEGRIANIEKARFLKKVHSISNVEFFQDDVRNLSKEKYGEFDVILCMGILYHLNSPDNFRLLENISNICTKAAIIDTHFSLEAIACEKFGKNKYWGKHYIEHTPDETEEEKEKKLKASLNNLDSFWLTKPSLFNLIYDCGFSTVLECPEMPRNANHSDRLCLLALKPIKKAGSVSAPDVKCISGQRWREDEWDEKLPFPGRFKGKRNIKDRIKSVVKGLRNYLRLILLLNFLLQHAQVQTTERKNAYLF